MAQYDENNQSQDSQVAVMTDRPRPRFTIWTKNTCVQVHSDPLEQAREIAETQTVLRVVDEKTGETLIHETNHKKRDNAMEAEAETFNGWTNRETWLANLWLENEYDAYKWSLAKAKMYAHNNNPLAAELLGGKLVNFLVDWRKNKAALRSDLSVYDLRMKVSAQELGEHWIETAQDHLRNEA
jgi:hypothetical protein